MVMYSRGSCLELLSRFYNFVGIGQDASFIGMARLDLSQFAITMFLGKRDNEIMTCV